MAGFDNEVLWANNVDFRGIDPPSAQVTADGQLLIGATASPNIRAGSVTSTGGTITITTGAGTLNLESAAAVPTTFNTDGTSATPAGNILAIVGDGIISTNGSGNTITASLTGVVPVGRGGTGTGSFTAGSIVFSNGSLLTQDNNNLFWDDSNNNLGIGTNTPIHDLEVQGHVGVIRTSIENDTHAMEITANAAGFSDFKAIDIDYVTGALAAGETEACILVNIDETSATGGQIIALDVEATTEGTDAVIALKTGIGVDAVRQETGTFGDLDNILNIAVDVTAALASGGAGNISIFVADDDTITLGFSTTWDELEVIIGTGASGGGVAPTFEFSTGGAGFTAFGPVDGTNGFRNTGVIDWDSSDLSGWVTNASGRFEIRITRTRNVLTTTPIVDEIQLSATTEHVWDASGNVNLNSLTLVTDLAVAHGGSGASTFTDGGVLIGSAASAFTALTVGTDGQLLVGDSANDPVFATVSSSDGSISFTTGAGTLSIQGTAASATQVGSVELATDAETNTGTSTVLAITPANITAWTGDTALVTLGTITTGTWTGTDIAVAAGGSGRSSHTAFAVLCGGTTSTAAQQSIAALGGSGDVLTSNGAAALPTMQTPAAAGGSNSWTEVTSTTASTDASIIFTALTSFDMYKFQFEAIAPSDDNRDFQIEFSIDNGSSYLSTGYYWSFETSSANNTSPADLTGAGQGNQASEEYYGWIVLSRNVEGSEYPSISGIGAYENSSGGSEVHSAVAINVDAGTSDVDAVRFTYSANNILSGTIRVFGR